MKRRTFLQQTATAAAISALAPKVIGGMPLYAQSPLSLLNIAEENDNILIVIQLFGGNDGLNTIVPVEDDEYYKIRPGLAVPKAKAIRYSSTDVYLHPALTTGITNNGLMGLMDDGRLAVVQGIGYRNPNLSHFRSTDIWLSGINSSDPNVRLGDGWIGRYFQMKLPNFPIEIPSDPLCVQFGGTLSLLFQSAKGDMGIALSDPQKFFELGQGLSPDEDFIAGNSSYANEFNFVRSIAMQSDTYSKVVKAAYDKGKNTVTYATGFAKQMGTIARLISGGLKTKVYMCYLGGFDTHVQQQDADLNGVHPNLLKGLATGISQFMQDALQQGFADRVAGITMSEFGRRPQENGSIGTDHGAAGIQFVFGPKVRGGVYGQNPDLKNLTANGDLTYQIDYRRTYVDILQTWFGATEEQTQTILGERVLPLNVLQQRVGVDDDVLVGNDKNALNIFPNPSRGFSTLQVEMRQPSKVLLELFDIRGTLVAPLYEGWLGAGVQHIPIRYEHSGAYFCSLTVGKRRFVAPLTIVK